VGAATSTSDTILPGSPAAILRHLVWLIDQE
jgi:hypothetical protein